MLAVLALIAIATAIFTEIALLLLREMYEQRQDERQMNAPFKRVSARMV